MGLSFLSRFVSPFFLLHTLPHIQGKLETDPALLIPKSRAALERYGHQVVIGNDLHRRKYEVVFVSRKLRSSPNGPVSNEPGFEESWLHIEQPLSSSTCSSVKEIEEDIVKELVRRHDKWTQTGRSLH